MRFHFAVMGVLLAFQLAAAQEGPLEEFEAKGGWLEIHSVGTANIAVYLPPGYGFSGVDYPVVYLLPPGGVGYGEYLTEPRSPVVPEEIEQYLKGEKARPMILVMPNRAVDTDGQYERYIARELVPFIDAHFRTLPTRESRAIAGYSEGANEALVTALSYPEVFGIVATFDAWWAQGLLDDVPGLLEAHDQERYPLQFWLVGGIASEAAIPPLVLEELEDRQFPYIYQRTDDTHREVAKLNFGEALSFLGEELESDSRPLRTSRFTEHFVLSTAPHSQTLDIEINLRPPLESGASLSVDLSALGRPESVPLADEGNGRYAASVPLPEPLYNGLYTVPVMRHDAAGDEFVLPIHLTIYPGSDAVMLSEVVAPEWTLATNSRLASTTAALDGKSALALEGSGSWNLTWNAVRPVDMFGYKGVRFDFHPADHTLPEGRDPRLLVGRVNLLERVNLGLKEWQRVVLDIEDLGLPEGVPLGILRFNGNLEGTFYLGDFRILAQETPVDAVTSVAENRQSSEPAAFSLEQNYPNPFNSGTVIPFALPIAGEVELAVFNLAGQQVATLAQGMRTTGQYRLQWDGRDAAGRELASGLYFYRLQTQEQHHTRKLLLLR